MTDAHIPDEKESPLAKPYRIALYQYIGGHSWFTVFSQQGEDDHRENFVRVSEWMDIKFTALTNDEALQNAVRALDEQERRVRNECNRQVAEIRQRKSELLAITHQPEPRDE